MKSLIALSAAVLLLSSASAQVTASRDTVMMGSAFAFTAVHQSWSEAHAALDAGIAEVARIEAVISSWNPTSETSAINRHAGIAPVKVSPELFALIERCKKVSALSNGYFDISFASLDKVWYFNGELTEIPTDEAIAQSVALIDYRNIVLDAEAQTVFLNQPGMKIGFGAIGKGYAANRAKAVMQAHGATAGVVNAGGDLLSWGNQTNGSPWTVGIADPTEAGNILSYLNCSNTAVVTSGNYEKYAIIDGERYCHIIDPKTGWPVRGLQSVTIICPDAELADALATTVFVLGETDGLALINHIAGVEAILVTDNSELRYSQNVELNFLSHHETTN